MSDLELFGWGRLRHGGLLLDPPRIRQVAKHVPEPLSWFYEQELRRAGAAIVDGNGDVSAFASLVLERVCGLSSFYGTWHRGSQVGTEWGRRSVSGETVKPRQLWLGKNDAVLPVFFDSEARIGIGRGRKAASQTVQWLRAGKERLALLTNGRQWRLIFAGLDFDAWCEWDVDLWFEEGALSPQVTALRTLFSEQLWIPGSMDARSPLLQAILDSRKGQSELSSVLGERVRETVELLVQSHGDVLKERCSDVDPADIYRASVRVVMRMVVVLFAESRELLPRDNALYHGSYGLTGLLEELEKVAARGGNRLARSWNAWPRVLALFRLVHQGSHHPALPVPAYGGDLFALGSANSADGLTRALAVFESAALEHEVVPDRDVHRMLERITRTRVKVKQGRGSTTVSSPVDFSDLSSEYIGILYEGLLDFELKTAPAGDPVVFLAVGNQPALPLSRLEQMDDRALGNLLENMKDTSGKDDESQDSAEMESPADEDEDKAEDSSEDEVELAAPDEEVQEAEAEDERHITRTRAENWARRAVEVGKLVKRPKGTTTPEKRRAFEESVGRKARQLVIKVVLPGEWYVVRWGGTRKGSGTFYTRPGLAVPTVQRTLRPLAYSPPLDASGAATIDAPGSEWTPRLPEEILALKVCDPACGSGTFPVAALRFLTDALYASLHHHGRIVADSESDRAVIHLLAGPTSEQSVVEERLGQELLPARPDDALFEPRLRAVLRRHVVERCIYGVDLDPLAVELCRLALWIETMDRSLPFSFLDHKIKCGNGLVGAWFDQFQHYPVMAWKNREGGDKNHSNGVHFEKESRTKAIKVFVKDTLTPDLQRFLEGRTLFEEDQQEKAETVHAEALATLARLHDLPVQDSAERARIYREELLGAPAYAALKKAMDLWCACWFWPTDKLVDAPLPSNLANPNEVTQQVAAEVSARKRFFHWELEFPDVFRAAGSGFDAILGNPPWETLQPNSKEFFSNLDPLYRAYGKQEALGYQSRYFSDPSAERDWLEYTGGFAMDSNWMKHAASPFGDPAVSDDNSERFSAARGSRNETIHARWRAARKKTSGFAGSAHPFRHRGEGKAYTYKLFIEQSYALLGERGRLGMIVPSGLYSDHGTRALRVLLLDHCSWEWLFGFENRDKVFDIHRSFKFNPIIVQKGGQTAAIRTAFMRRKLEDWERAEEVATVYARAQVERFSPRSKAILEIQSQRDLEILEKIYSNSVLLGDDGPDGWGIKYAQGDFNMTSDSKLFPPRPKWEEQGYRPDEYSRWLKGDWRPIAELWSTLGIDPSVVVPIDAACLERMQGADVQRTEWRVRCAQPPYDALPIPRADIPAGIVLSREGDAWIREEGVEDVALPLYQGVMVQPFDFSAASWISGTGLNAKWDAIGWERKNVTPQYLVSAAELKDRRQSELGRVGYRDIARTTDQRTMIAAALPGFPAGNKVPVLSPSRTSASTLAATLNTWVFDWVLRTRQGSASINYYILEEMPLPQPRRGVLSERPSLSLGASSTLFASAWLRSATPTGGCAMRRSWGCTKSERTRLRCIVDAIEFCAYGLDGADMRRVLAETVLPTARLLERQAAYGLEPKGFWRVDKELDPTLRHSVLTTIALDDLSRFMSAADESLEDGVEAFLTQNDGQGWLLPTSLCLSDYGLGHDDSARVRQPVASVLGPRFYDWQLAQTAEESWRECSIHARNLRGYDDLEQVPKEMETASRSDFNQSQASQSVVRERLRQRSLFD